MNEEKLETAKARVKDLKEFYQHVVAYVAVNILLVIINLLTSTGYLWFLWPLCFWGLALVIHGLYVFTVTFINFGERKILKKIENIIFLSWQIKKLNVLK